jgi:hypothetical protein
VDANLRNKIEKRAYEIFLHRGAQPGHHFDDWVKAEKEVMAEMSKGQAQQAQKKSAFPQKKKY